MIRQKKNLIMSNLIHTQKIMSALKNLVQLWSRTMSCDYCLLLLLQVSVSLQTPMIATTIRTAIIISITTTTQVSFQLHLWTKEKTRINHKKTAPKIIQMHDNWTIQYHISRNLMQCFRMGPPAITKGKWWPKLSFLHNTRKFTRGLLFRLMIIEKQQLPTF